MVSPLSLSEARKRVYQPECCSTNKPIHHQWKRNYNTTVTIRLVQRCIVHLIAACAKCARRDIQPMDACLDACGNPLVLAVGAALATPATAGRRTCGCIRLAHASTSTGFFVLSSSPSDRRYLLPCDPTAPRAGFLDVGTVHTRLKEVQKRGPFVWGRRAGQPSFRSRHVCV
jgi:hypothetical protein